jgi:hypothetical protein
MKPKAYDGDWREILRRRHLSPDQLAELKSATALKLANAPVPPVGDPGAAPSASLRDFESEFDAESALNAALDLLPAPPSVSSNFNARLFAAIEADRRKTSAVRPPFWSRWLETRWHRLWACSFATVTVGLGLWWQVSIGQRGSLAQSVADVSQAASVPGVALLRDFNAIAALGAQSRVQPSDVELMAMLSK